MLLCYAIVSDRTQLFPPSYKRNREPLFKKAFQLKVEATLEAFKVFHPSFDHLAYILDLLSDSASH